MKKKINAYIMLDVSKKEPRLCYGTEDKRKGLIAVFFHEVSRPIGWVKEKTVIPCVITYDTRDLV